MLMAHKNWNEEFWKMWKITQSWDLSSTQWVELSNKYFSVIVSNRLGLSHPLHNPLRRTNERNVGVCGQLSVSPALSADLRGGGVSAHRARRRVTRCDVSFVRQECLGQWKVRAAPFRSHPGWRHHKSADMGLVAKTTGQEMRAGKLSSLQIEFETVMILLILSLSKLVSNSIVIVGGAHHLGSWEFNKIR